MAKLLDNLAGLHDAVTMATFQLSRVCLGIVLFSYCFEVVARYFFNAPQWWADEAVSYGLCIGAFTMLPYVTKEKGHVAVTLIVERLSPGPARVWTWMIYLVGFLTCALATWICLDETVRQIVDDVYLMKVRPLPKWWISIFLVYGFGSSALYFLRLLSPRQAAYAGRDGRIQ
ncbi:MAG: TRAP transporter small permease [Rhodospirillales bacterium]